jgi:hypothetical protein
MRKLLLTTSALLAFALPAQADIVRSGIFTSDHCTGGCGPQTGGFATITATDHENGIIDISIAFNNNNSFANGGQDVVFGFNLIGDPTITYSGLNTTLFEVPGGTGANSLTQSAGTLHANGFGNFEYGIDLTTSGASTFVGNQTFSISGTGLDITDFAQLSSGGDVNAYFALDILSGTTGRTGFVDLSTVLTPTQQSAVPEPATWAMMILGFFGVGFMAYRRRNQTAAFRIA